MGDSMNGKFLGSRTKSQLASITVAALALACVLVHAGCASRKATEVTYHDPNMDFSLIQTVAVMPFDNLSTNPRAGEAVRDVFMTMLQATGSIYVLPPGEVGRGMDRMALGVNSKLTAEDFVQFANIVGADVVITGTVLEYGELRSGGSSGGVVSLGVRMLEAETGRVVWSASSSAGGVSAGARVFGGGGKPMDRKIRKAVSKLLDRLFG
jgi:hypothetical protein